MFHYGVEALHINPQLLAPYTRLYLTDGEAWQVSHRQVVILPPGNIQRRRLSCEGLPISALWWDARGIQSLRQGYHWQPTEPGETAPWLETIHHSWPYHPPLWLLDTELVVLHSEAFATDRRRRQQQQRSLLRFWSQRRTPLIYLALDGRDAWHMERLVRDPTMSPLAK